MHGHKSKITPSTHQDTPLNRALSWRLAWDPCDILVSFLTCEHFFRTERVRVTYKTKHRLPRVQPPTHPSAVGRTERNAKPTSHRHTEFKLFQESNRNQTQRFSTLPIHRPVICHRPALKLLDPKHTQYYTVHVLC